MPDFVPTDEQDEILSHDPDRHARVLAGPGTGKSATLVALIDQLLGEDPVLRIKLLTFTRAATSELAQRVSEHPTAAAEKPSTIHSFAISVLLRNPGTGDFPEPLRIADDWENLNIVYPSLARRVGVTTRELRRLIQEMASNWESLQVEELDEVAPATRARFLGAWNEHRAIYGYTLLAELPYQLRNALRDHPDLRGVDYDLLLVDEYQDLNACDLEALRLISERGCSIIGVGDDDQSIYSFRKAAPEGIRRFLADYPGAGDYPLSVTHRCGSRIIEWASHVIQGDPDRPADRPQLTSADGSPPGNVGLLSFASERAEATGVAALIHTLVETEGVEPSDILVLVRGDHNAMFSGPITKELAGFGIGCSDPDLVKRMLDDAGNRRMLAVFRLLAHREDSIAWATLLFLTNRIGAGFLNYIYDRARVARCQFGRALLDAFTDQFSEGPTAPSRRAAELIRSVMEWLDEHPVPDPDDDDNDEFGWGQWIIDTADGDVVPSPSDQLAELLIELDDHAEPNEELSRFINQIAPLGKDLALSHSDGVRIMSMGGAKGLTVRATIVVALEDGIVPRPDGDLAEERRLLYVAMTRAKEYLYITWARRRQGPTARAGAARVVAARRHTHFLDGGPIESTDGAAFLRAPQFEQQLDTNQPA